MVIGEKGCIYTGHWNNGGLIRLAGEPRLKDVLHHPATKDIPETLPRVKGHDQEWSTPAAAKARRSPTSTSAASSPRSAFPASSALRAGKNLDWDGEKMEARNCPEAARFVHTPWRTKWL